MEQDWDVGWLLPRLEVETLNGCFQRMRCYPAVAALCSVAAEENDVGAIPSATGRTVFAVVVGVPLHTATLAETAAALVNH